MRSSEKITSYHEMGHVCGFIEMGIRFSYVTIAPNRNSRSHVLLGHVQPYKNVRQPASFKILNHMCAIVAEAKIRRGKIEKIQPLNHHLGVLDHHLEGMKYANCPENIKEIYPNYHMCRRNALYRFLKLAIFIINRDWLKIEIAAKELQEKKTMTYYEVMKIWKDNPLDLNWEKRVQNIDNITLHYYNEILAHILAYQSG